MKYTTIVVLAKSQKRGGYCVAGRELFMDGQAPCLGAWKRMVSSDRDSHGAIFDKHFHISGYNTINVFDVVRVPVITAQTQPGQPDNILINENECWEIEGRMPASLIASFADNPANLWWQTGVDSNIVPSACDDVTHVLQSLYLIKPEKMLFRLTHDYNSFEGYYQRKISVSFEYKGLIYSHLAVTDPKVKRMLRRKFPGPGSPVIELALLKGDNYFLCVSLSPRFGAAQHHYKLVATVFDFDGYLQEHYH